MKSLILLSLALVSFSATLSLKRLSLRGLDDYPSSDASDQSGICYKQSYGRIWQDTQTTCAEGENIGSNCYGACPDGYYMADSDGFPESSDEITGGHGPQLYCWQPCPDGLDDRWSTCATLTDYGQTTFLPDEAFDGPRFADNEADCDQYSPQGCENCDGNWVGLGNCGSCSLYCPVTCPDGLVQIDEYTCQKNFIDRPIVGTTTCPDGFAQDVADNFEQTDDPCYSIVPEGYSCNVRVCYGGCPQGWKECGEALCVNGDQCDDELNDLNDFSYEVSAALESLSADTLIDPSQGASITYFNTPGANLTYPMCH